jgi:hypothetical protein
MAPGIASYSPLAFFLSWTKGARMWPSRKVTVSLCLASRIRANVALDAANRIQARENSDRHAELCEVTATIAKDLLLKLSFVIRLFAPQARLLKLLQR